MKYLITAEGTLAAARRDGVEESALKVERFAVMTFNRAVLDRLTERCGLADVGWLSPRHHPYAAPEVVKRGTYQGVGVTVLVPPLGASPLACVAEDLVACGAKVLVLACAAWSLGEPVRFGDLVVPRTSIGLDGTSIHYGNRSKRVAADEELVGVLVQAARERGAAVHVGGNATCEAPYRITPRMVASFRRRGCLSMENGEASALFALARSLGIRAAALFQPYIDLTQGWDPARFDERYQATGRLQAEVALAALSRLGASAGESEAVV
jgi:uridine phosphorylase